MTAPPDHAYAAALAGLDTMTPSRLRRLLAASGAAEHAWALVASGRTRDLIDLRSPRAKPEGIARRLAEEAASVDVGDLWARCRANAVRIVRLGDPDYPSVLAVDRAPPAVLFCQGDLGALAPTRVAIVGTRAATANGCSIARELGAELSLAGVCVLSGLARGIDGHAHRGALAAAAASPVGVVACGLDVVYPAEHRELWQRIARVGLLLSEVPPGCTPRPHRFPARNRILAALSDAVVVVESRARGGSLVTANEAIERGVRVLAVPGSPRSAASEGTNGLIADGCPPARDATDVLVALGFSALDLRPSRDSGDDILPFDRRLLECFGGEPLDLDRLIAATGEPLATVAMALGRLELGGWIVHSAGWFERTPRPPRGYRPLAC
jgi:DNA processing protein